MTKYETIVAEIEYLSKSLCRHDEGDYKKNTTTLLNFLVYGKLQEYYTYEQLNAHVDTAITNCVDSGMCLLTGSQAHIRLLDMFFFFDNEYLTGQEYTAIKQIHPDADESTYLRMMPSQLLLDIRNEQRF